MPKINGVHVKQTVVSGSGNGGTALTVAVTDMDFTEVSDSTGAWDGTTYTVQNSNSIINIVGQMSLTTNASRFVGIYKNGLVLRDDICNFPGSTSTHSFNFQIAPDEISEGDSLSIRIATGSGGGTLNNISAHYITIVETQIL